ncbi:MAG: hypothetical protein KZQ66_00810 [Candidatus Thiodiazotropha sp. (ex Lucinoma aequizonata)]|nr:hypothetical protein [Candidatus Thiodiazotropha sp. (ex Lucinoma aequizonata)]MCU7900732.1 hypothetical protein [Candidatus Thiodiazotropha sp. (ex Lucinoma aequizonata)]
MANTAQLRVKFDGSDITPEIEYLKDQLSIFITQIIHWPTWMTSNLYISFEELGTSNVGRLISDIELYHIPDSYILPLNQINLGLNLTSNTLITWLLPGVVSRDPVSLSYKISVVSEEDDNNDYSKQIIEGVYELDKNKAVLTSKELGTYKWYF